MLTLCKDEWEYMEDVQRLDEGKAEACKRRTRRNEVRLRKNRSIGM